MCPAAKETCDRTRSGTVLLNVVVALTAIVAGVTVEGRASVVGRHLALDVLEGVAVDVAEVVPNTSAFMGPGELELVDLATRLARNLVYISASVQCHFSCIFIAVCGLQLCPQPS
jgi:hypothetical protein